MSAEPEAERIDDLERRVAELRRVNAGLARELAAAKAPRRPASVAAVSRRIAQLEHERDTAVADLRAAGEELAWLRPAHEELRGEVERLRGGLLGLLRRLQARILRS